jgi:hypothetical protein
MTPRPAEGGNRRDRLLFALLAETHAAVRRWPCTGRTSTSPTAFYGSVAPSLGSTGTCYQRAQEERSRRNLSLSTANVALLRSIKAGQAVERLKADSIWVETGLVFTTARGTAVGPRNALRAINTADTALGLSDVGSSTKIRSTPP